jgi:hypothetical protein
LLVLGLVSQVQPARAEPNLTGETGFIYMPDGRLAQDGTFRMGYGHAEPYTQMWFSTTFLPNVELYARYQRIMTGAIGTGSARWQGYGDYKDKVASVRFRLLEESESLPAIAFGMDDLQGTGLFPAKYLAASKRFGDLDVSLGYGSGRLDGPFGGVRYAPGDWGGLTLVAEYDANNYQQDHLAKISGVYNRQKGVGMAVEYRHGWLGSQFSCRDGKPGLNLYAAVPLQDKEFIPNFQEPEPDLDIVERVAYARWTSDPHYHHDLFARLLRQDFRNIHLKVREGVIEASLTNIRISLPSRAVGRAARTLLLRAPLGTREIKVHYTVAGQAFATYTFTDANRLQRYFSGFETRKQLAPTVSVQYAEPLPADMRDELFDALEEAHADTYLDGEAGDIVSYRREGAGLSRIKVAPALGFYFNDPSGALKYELFGVARYDRQLDEGLFLNSSIQLTLLQNVSDVTQASNSLLPHVRTDVAEYKRTGQFKLSQFVLNKFFQPRQRLYGRVSAGLYEEMFGGAGGQLLYYPASGPWALDLTVDALRQRDFGGGLAFRDYSTVTALAALHYRLPLSGLTATVRGGRFLARDKGARFELKRRFRSGVEIGAWYTLTDGRDITAPGTPAQPYHDKGVFVSIPLSSMLARDSQVAPTLSISPWTRDVGQMVTSPGDLYSIMESSYLNLKDGDGLQYFGDLDDSWR